jgi:hypothetical protein
MASWLGRSARQQPSRAMPLSVAVRLLPTPRVSGGIMGSPNQHGSKGDPTPPSAAINLPHRQPPSDRPRTSGRSAGGRRSTADRRHNLPKPGPEASFA